LGTEGSHIENETCLNVIAYNCSVRPIAQQHGLRVVDDTSDAEPGILHGASQQLAVSYAERVWHSQHARKNRQFACALQHTLAQLSEELTYQILC